LSEIHCPSDSRRSIRTGVAIMNAPVDAPATPLYPGNPAHPQHEVYLLELGRATYAAARLAGAAFDILRIHEGIDSVNLYNDPLGRLQRRLKKANLTIDGIDDFLELLDESRIVRNDLIHAMPVNDGLYRRTADDLYYVREFFTIESLQEARILFEETSRKGNEILYFDSGEAVRKWHAEE